MKRRVRKIANFFAFNLLFFALYLNFIHKDKSNTVVTGVAQTSTQQNPAAFSGTTVLVETPQQELQKNTSVTEKSAEGATALKLSIN
ncbi:MAG: hypothetical protein ABIT05_13140 [Chitinophagaceae bacterium]